MSVNASPCPVRARSVSRPVLARLAGPVREGVGLGQGFALFDGWVLALTRPGRPRMPNGVECDVALAAGQPCRIGGGWLVVGKDGVLAGPAWDPRPRPPAARPRMAAPRLENLENLEGLEGLERLEGPPRELAERFAGRGPGLTPAGDDLLAGYAAGLVILRGRDREARAIVRAALSRTTSLSATLLRHAARGELPEPAHAFLEQGRAEPLLSFGHSSGRALLAGLAAAAGGPA